MPNHTIRQATPSDYAILKEIIDLSFQRFFRYFAWHSVSDPDEPVLVSEAEGIVVGFAKLIEFKVGGGKYGCILWIAVHPAYRRRGLALALTNSGEDYLKQRGSQAVFASTQRRNSAGIGNFGQGWVCADGFFGFVAAFWVASDEFLQRYLVCAWRNRVNA